MKKILIFVSAVIFLSFSQYALADKADRKEKKYFEPTYKNFAKTYWRFSKLEIEDDTAIDNFMKITECDLYNEYLHNEFEWGSIRQSTRNFIQTNIKKFPNHYAFMQPISLGDYDFQKGGFSVASEHALKGAKRLEITSDKVYANVCGDKYSIPGYPKSIALELTRPIIFDFFEVDSDIAKEVIHRKMKAYNTFLDSQKTRENFLKAREVILVAKVKIFAFSGDITQNKSAYKNANALGILERIEIYEDRTLKNLLFSEDYRRKKRNNRG